MKDQIVNGRMEGGRPSSFRKMSWQSSLVSARVTVREHTAEAGSLGLSTKQRKRRFLCGKCQHPDTFAASLVQTAFISDNSLGEILQFRKMIEGAVCQEACKKAEKKMSALPRFTRNGRGRKRPAHVW